MKALTCEMCGSTEIIRKDGLYVCQACGTKYSVEDAKKMMAEGTVEVKGTVKIDKSHELDNLIHLCESALEANNCEEALSYANRILEVDSSLYQGWLMKMQATAGLGTLYDLRCQEIISLGEKTISYAKDDSEIIEVYNYWLHTFNGLMQFCINNLYDPARQQNCLDIYYSQKEAFGTGYTQDECLANDEVLNIICNQVPALASIRLAIPNDKIGSSDILIQDVKVVANEWVDLQQAINANFNNYETGMSDELLKYFIDIHNEIIKGLPASSKAEVSLENTAQDSGMSNESNSSGPCYVATAIYGSYNCQEVWTLRRFRDYTLAESWYGRLFIRVYYAISPSLVKHFGHSKWFRAIFHSPLNRFVKCLQNKGVESTPYVDKCKF